MTSCVHKAYRVCRCLETANRTLRERFKMRLVYIDGPVPMLRLNYFEEVAKKCAALGDELWLRGFITRFLGELIFTHGRTTVAIKVVEIALTVVTRQIDLAPVVLAEMYHGLDRISHSCCHFHGWGP